MRIFEITQPTDPVLSDTNFVNVLTHYMGADFVDYLRQVSPYADNSPYARYRQIYDRIAASVKPLLQTHNLNVDLIIKTINRQLPIVSLPQWVQERVRRIDNIDQQKTANPGAPYTISGEHGQKWEIEDDEPAWNYTPEK